MIGAFVGGVIGSEWITTMATPGPVWDGIALIPALVGGAMMGAIVALIMLVRTGQTHSEGGGQA